MRKHRNHVSDFVFDMVLVILAILVLCVAIFGFSGLLWSSHFCMLSQGPMRSMSSSSTLRAVASIAARCRYVTLRASNDSKLLVAPS